jgi:hypothetical protein
VRPCADSWLDRTPTREANKLCNNKLSEADECAASTVFVSTTATSSEGGLKLVAGVGFEPTIRQPPDYEPENSMAPIISSSPTKRLISVKPWEA